MTTSENGEAAPGETAALAVGALEAVPVGGAPLGDAAFGPAQPAVEERTSIEIATARMARSVQRVVPRASFTVDRTARLGSHGGMKTNPVAMVLVLVVAGCDVEETREDAMVDEDVGVAHQAQLDPGNFEIRQNAAIVGAVWRGRISTGADVEYWVKRSTYVANAARTFEGAGTSTSCSAFRTMVCGWTGATRYKATVTHAPLNCGAPPSTITAPGGAVSFLAPGSYRTTNAGTPFAWTYVSGNVEYWAMNDLVPSTLGAQRPQGPLTPPYTSFGNFVSSVCATTPAPTEWLTQYLVAQPAFCSANPC